MRDIIVRKKTREKKAGKRFRKESLYEFLCCVPALILIILIAYYPSAELFRISLTDWNLIKRDYHYVGLTNWIWLVDTIKQNHVLDSFAVTLKYTVGHMMIVLIGGLLLALLFHRMTKGFAFMRSVVFMPYYIAMSTAALIFLVILNEQFGVANYIVEFFGGARVKWLSDGKMALLMMIVIASWKSVGYNMLIYLSGMGGISEDYKEAAMLDGAGKKDVLVHITLPLLGPTTVFLAVTQFISSMKVYALVDVLTAGGPYRATEAIVYMIYTLAFEDFRVDRAAVVSICFFVFLLAVTKVTMKYTDRAVNYDA